ncbi:MAG: class II glutamine amidotransferase [Lachnospiraceae bacterium]|nr:class II glutamine amidotransferase [Lachnospiraceae bacterium]
MCELFGFNSRYPYVINEYLKTFFSHSIHHPHGWGLACLDDGECSLEKEPIKAADSHYLKERLTMDINSRTVLAHIRYATIGNLGYKNCHPYSGNDSSGRRWTLIHNGTIFQYEPINGYIHIQAGTTDSERVFLYLIDQMNLAMNKKGGPLNEEERFDVLDAMIVDMAKGNKLNLMIYDGEQLYVHMNAPDTLHYFRKRDFIMFATTPLSKYGWEDMPLNTLYAFKEGRPIYKGTTHDGSYIMNPEDYKYLYQEFANL